MNVENIAETNIIIKHLLDKITVINKNISIHYIIFLLKFELGSLQTREVISRSDLHFQ